MELKVWVDGIQRVVCGVSEQTTCQEVVIALARAIGEPSPSAGGCHICRFFLEKGVLGWVEVLLCGGGDASSTACGAAASALPCWPLLSRSDVLTSSRQVRRAAMCWCRSCGRRSGSCCLWSVPWSRWPSVGSMPTTCSSSCGGRAPAWPSGPPRAPSWTLPTLPRGRSSGPACPSSPGSPA